MQVKQPFFVLKKTGRKNEYLVSNPFDRQPFKPRDINIISENFAPQNQYQQYQQNQDQNAFTSVYARKPEQKPFVDHQKLDVDVQKFYQNEDETAKRFMKEAEEMKIQVQNQVREMQYEIGLEKKYTTRDVQTLQNQQPIQNRLKALFDEPYKTTEAKPTQLFESMPNYQAEKSIQANIKAQIVKQTQPELSHTQIYQQNKNNISQQQAPVIHPRLELQIKETREEAVKRLNPYNISAEPREVPKYITDLSDKFNSHMLKLQQAQFDTDSLSHKAHFATILTNERQRLEETENQSQLAQQLLLKRIAELERESYEAQMIAIKEKMQQNVISVDNNPQVATAQIQNQIDQLQQVQRSIMQSVRSQETQETAISQAESPSTSSFTSATNVQESPQRKMSVSAKSTSQVPSQDSPTTIKVQVANALRHHDISVEEIQEIKQLINDSMQNFETSKSPEKTVIKQDKVQPQDLLKIGQIQIMQTIKPKDQESFIPDPLLKKAILEKNNSMEDLNMRREQDKELLNKSLSLTTKKHSDTNLKAERKAVAEPLKPISQPQSRPISMLKDKSMSERKHDITNDFDEEFVSMKQPSLNIPSLNIDLDQQEQQMSFKKGQSLNIELDASLTQTKPNQPSLIIDLDNSRNEVSKHSLMTELEPRKSVEKTEKVEVKKIKKVIKKKKIEKLKEQLEQSLEIDL
ncbi:Conserved_hypothetical protein [Hexamita inflata]|uniref:Uncharacterized protein n=1 Tax=Hexamita inflata TaxID=28002 RepID=A0AA86NNA2_9EUKA|nr:Conserved hypothetical protein [Hexamita inflata]